MAFLFGEGGEEEKLDNFKYIFLIGIYFFYSLISVMMKYYSKFSSSNVSFYKGITLIFILFFIYSLLWQQILKLFKLFTAFSFKGSTIIFTLILSKFFFGDEILPTNILGSLIIIAGIVVVSKNE